MKAKPLPTQERLKELLNYDPETGVFTWKVERPGMQVDNIAGTTTSNGYVRIAVDGLKYLANRLAWMYHFGEDPGELSVDHRNRNPSKNNIVNLRLASHSQNRKNTASKGFIWEKARKKWRAQIKVNNKYIFLGRYHCQWQAHEAYWDARYKYFGEFA